MRPYWPPPDNKKFSHADIKLFDELYRERGSNQNLRSYKQGSFVHKMAILISFLNKCGPVTKAKSKQLFDHCRLAKLGNFDPKKAAHCPVARKRLSRRRRPSEKYENFLIAHRERMPPKDSSPDSDSVSWDSSSQDDDSDGVSRAPANRTKPPAATRAPTAAPTRGQPAARPQPAPLLYELASESDDGDTDKVAGSDSSFVIPSTSDSEHGDTLPRQKGKCVAAQVPAHAPRQPAPRRQPAVPAVHTHPLAKMNADLKKTVQELQREIATQKNGIVKLNKLNEELRAQMKRERDAKKLVLKRNFKLQRECNDAKKIITRLQSNITNFMDMVKLAENQYLVA